MPHYSCSCRGECKLLCCVQNRYIKSAKDWGWREFITLQALFDADAGYLMNDDCVFAAEVLMLKESSEAHQVGLQPPSTSVRTD